MSTPLLCVSPTAEGLTILLMAYLLVTAFVCLASGVGGGANTGVSVLFFISF